jgi:hypothetical protein
MTEKFRPQITVISRSKRSVAPKLAGAALSILGPSEIWL